MRKHYIKPSVETWHIAKATSLLNTLSTGGVVDEWIQDETEMDESNYF